MAEPSHVPSSGSAVGTAFPTKSSNKLKRTSDVSNAEALSLVNLQPVLHHVQGH